MELSEQCLQTEELLGMMREILSSLGRRSCTSLNQNDVILLVKLGRRQFVHIKFQSEYCEFSSTLQGTG